MSTTSENGRIAIVAVAVSIEIIGATANSQPFAVRGRNCALKSSLPMSAIGCIAPNGTDPVGAVAVLEAAEHLALGEQRDRHDLEDDGEDRDRLQDLHPPRLVVADLADQVHVTSRGGIGSGGGRRRLGEALDGGCDLRGDRARLDGAGTDPVQLDEPAGQDVGAVLARALGEEDVAGGDRGAQLRGGRDAAAVADLDPVAVV